MRNRADRQEPGRRAAAVAGIVTRNPREAVGILMASAATLVIFINALFMQTGPHPAPIFSPKSAPVTHLLPPASVGAPIAPQPVLPPASLLTPVPTPTVAQRARGQITADIQRELSKRGFYSGILDGVWGAQTDTGIRDFAAASGLKLEPQATEAVLAAIAESKIHAAKAGVPSAARNDPIAQLLSPSRQVIGVQRALSDFGYGQIKPNGEFGPETREAIEKFERAHKMPVSGQISDGLLRALSAMTGRPLD